MTDQVDELVAGWALVRPDLDLEPLQLLSRLRRVSRLLDDGRDQAFASHELAAYEFDVLAALRRSGEAAELTPGQLLEATHVTSGTMTNRLDRLETRKLITRRPHPSDGRQALIRLTAAGRRRVDGALESLLEYERAVLEVLGSRERAATVRSLRRLLAEQGS